MSGRDIKDLRRVLDRKQGQRDQVIKDLDRAKGKVKYLKQEVIFSEQAQAIINLVSRQTQEQLEVSVSDIVSSALAAILPKPYEFEMKYSIKRDRPECLLSLLSDTERLSPMSEVGGGIIDIVSFALRIACWVIQQPRSQNIIVLDEPFRFLSAEYIPRASELIRELSDKLGLQFIIVTHIPELTESADRVFKISKAKEGVTTVDQID